jgi:large subunit ribosomal protein LP0
MPLTNERKKEYFERMKNLLLTYSKAFVVEVDNVGSGQLQNTRKGLRGRAEILMGKNTMMRKCIREFVEENPGSPIGQLEALCRGNVGFVFTNSDLAEVRTVIESNVRPAPARVGSIAPIDVIVPKGPTGCDPGQTNFFQTLQISTKITKGQIEMTNDTHLICTGEKVTASQAALLQKLGIEPFTYGMELKSVYDNGSLFDAKVLDITDDVLATKFASAVSALASISLALGYPTQASVPHSISNAFRSILSVSLGCESYSFQQADIVKKYIADPSIFSSSSLVNENNIEEENMDKNEAEEEMDLGGGMDMFGGNDEEGY